MFSWLSRARLRTPLSLAVVAALVLGVFGSVIVAESASAADPGGDLDLQMSVDHSAVAPGGSFSYTMTVGCSTFDCVDATLTDTLPAAFSGFTINPTVNVTGVTAKSASWSGNTLTVHFLSPLDGGGTGLAAGSSPTVQITLTAPGGLAPEWPSNGSPVANPATLTATGSTDATASANVTVTVPYRVSTATTVSWDAPSAQYHVGGMSTITATTANTSNAYAQSLVLDQPNPAATKNVFDWVDFAGFGTVTFPAGADRIQVDACTDVCTSDADPGWVLGAAGSSPQLPSGVDAADVTNLRITFTSSTGATIAPGGAAGSVPITVAQRAALRSDPSSSLLHGDTVTDAVIGTVTVPDRPAATNTASTTYGIGALTVQVGGSFVFEGAHSPDARIAAGSTVDATISGENDSNGPLSTLTLTGPTGFFTDKVMFEGFGTSIPKWPTGATSAKVTWTFDDGSTRTSAAFGAGVALPSAPSVPGHYVKNFAVTYTGTDAGIAKAADGGQATVRFTVGVAADEISSGSQILPASVSVTGHNDAGDATPVTFSAQLTVLAPTIAVIMDATSSPAVAVPAGGRSSVQLTANTSSDSGYVDPTEITVIDALDPSDPTDYWRAFDAVAVAPTAVSLGSTLDVYYTRDGSTWILLSSADGTFMATTYSAAIPAGVIGLKFDYKNATGFAKGSVVQSSISFQARATLRDSETGGDTGIPTATDGDSPQYTNNASAEVVGSVSLGVSTPITRTATSSAAAVAEVKVLTATSGGGSGGSGGSGGDVGPGTGNGLGGLIFTKAWQPPAAGVSTDVAAQSGQQRTTRLGWGTEVNGYESAVITDPADLADSAPTPDVSQSAFQAFDLLSISPITAATDPLIAYDEVTEVDLYNQTTKKWVAVSDCTTASPCEGGFPGYVLSAAERASTIGVRITFAEFAGARANTGSPDPLAPPIGSGVASGETQRPLDLVFQLRDQLRSPGGAPSPWITKDTVLNNGAGSVTNVAQLDLVTATDGTTSDDESDSISVIDNLPQLSFSKSVDSTAFAIPHLGDVTASGYPKATYTVKSTNTSAARAWYLRITDPMPCADTAVTDCVHNSDPTTKGYAVAPYDGYVYDPTTNPFEQLTMTGATLALCVTKPDGSCDATADTGIDLGSSTITLLHLDNGLLSTTTVKANAIPSGSALADVVGISGLFTGTDTSGGGTIASGATVTLKIATQLRQYLRSQPAAQLTQANSPSPTNNAFTQIWDNVLDDTNRYDSAPASIALSDAVVKAATSESLSASSILEANRANPIAITLKGNSGGATASTHQVVLEDSDPTFWKTFRLVSLGTPALPSGANRIEVDYQLDGSGTWTTGTPSTAASLPSGLDLSRITGLRFVYTRSDGTLFSTSSSASAVAWNLSQVLNVAVRPTLLGGGAVAFPSTIANPITITSTHNGMTPATASGSATVALDPGTFKLSISKTVPFSTTAAGQQVPFTLTATNTGTGFLNNPVIKDTLPADGSLVYDPTAEIDYADSTGGILSTTTVTTAFDAAGRTLTFSWAAGSRLAPGETFTITLPLQVAVGLAPGIAAINTLIVSSDRTLAQCKDGSGAVIATNASSCQTTAQVSTIHSSALTSFKGVKGNVDADGSSVSGAVNVNNPATPCATDPQGFYRSPCVADSVIGGDDLWKLQITNGGNIDSDTASVVDVLPAKNDTYLKSTSKRGSTYAPVFDGALTVAPDALSANLGYTWYVSTSANPCGTTYGSAPDCGTSWQPGSSYPTADYAKVKAIKVVFDFSTLSGGVFPPTSTIAVTYRTKNTPTTAANDGRAPVTAPVSGAQAWNSFGVHATFVGGDPVTVEPVRAGVQLATGPIQVTKVIDGDSAAYAPTSYAVTVSCTVAGAPVTLPNSGVLTLNSTSTVPYTGRIDGIPVGALCSVVENPGSKPSAVAYSPTAGGAPSAAVVTVATAADSTVPVPVGQQATVTNTYGLTSLTVSKAVTSDTTVGSFGPFDFGVTCVVNNGAATKPVPLAAGDSAFTLADGQSHLIDALPVNAVCSVAETDSDAATSISIAADGGTGTAVAEGQSVAVALPAGSVHTAVVTNHYDGGQLAVTKTVAGDGGATYGSGPFTVHADCSYDGTSLFSGSLSISGGETKTFAPVFPVGTSCAVAETTQGGATSSAGDATVGIPGPTGDETVGLVTVGITNTFAEGSLTVVKRVTGDGAAAYGSGPFQAQVACTWVKDGDTLTIPLPDSGLVDLTAANDYTATVTGLIVGASCAVTETRTGGATVPAGVATAPSIPATGAATVTIANEFDTGSLVIVKDRTGEGVARFGDGPFTVAVSCDYVKDGATVPIDLGADATQRLTAANGYRATIDHLLVGASCTVSETDAGLAVSSSRTPSDGTVTIVDSGESTQATVHVINDFQIGHLAITKTASNHLVQGLTSYHYTLGVKNTDTINATGVTVVDPLDSALELTNVDAAGWTCALAGEDADGFGGTVTCGLDADLGAGETAPDIVLDVTVKKTIAQDSIGNTATVTSTNPIVDGDSASDPTPVLVKWLDVTATGVCVKDAPWLDYSVDAHNLDVSGHTMKVTWADRDGTEVHEDDVPVTADGTITGQLLWPGAAVDASGEGVAWPGWRNALPGEAPDWEGMVLDPTAYGYALRDKPQVTISINPQTTVTVDYPPATPDCVAGGTTSTGVTRHPDLTFSKKASVHEIDPGQTFRYTMSVGNRGLGSASDVTLVDDVPDTLQILSVQPATSGAGSPSWTSCAVTGVGTTGFGGTVTCLLDRPLNYGQSAPDVYLTVKVSKTIPAGVIVNTGRVTGVDPDLGELPTLALHDTAMVMTGGMLAFTGVVTAPTLLVGLAALLAGLAFVSWRILFGSRRRSRHGRG